MLFITERGFIMTRTIMITCMGDNYINYTDISKVFEEVDLEHNTYAMSLADYENDDDLAVITYDADISMHKSIVKELEKVLKGSARVIALRKI